MATVPFDGAWLWLGVVILAALGLAVAIELQIVHVNAWSGKGGTSFCAINAEWNCDTVARSPYSVFLGVPVSMWGILGYVTIAGTGLLGWLSRGSRAMVPVFGGLAVFSAGTSALLGTIAKLYIQSICVLCLTTYAINAVLLIIAVILWKRAGQEESRLELVEFLETHRGALVPGALFGVMAALGLMAFHPKYWDFSAPALASAAAHEGASPTASNLAAKPASLELPSGVTDDGHPWIGAPEPKLTIVEFSDYQCPFCERSHLKLRELIQAHPQAIRLVHRHFPLDQACNPIITEPFHPQSCLYSQMSVCAGEQKKFWAANDFLFLHGREPDGIEPQRLAKDLGIDLGRLTDCLERRGAGMIRGDLDEGVKLKINGTPSFLVNGKLYQGELPPEVLAPFLSGH